jgi:hypothetical protein
MMAAASPMEGWPWWVRAGMYFGLPAIGLGFMMFWARQDALADRSEIKQLLQHVCVNTARSEESRRACLIIHRD